MTGKIRSFTQAMFDDAREHGLNIFRDDMGASFDQCKGAGGMQECK